MRSFRDLNHFTFISNVKELCRNYIKLFYNKTIILLLISISIIPQIFHINRIVTNNVLSGDWYLARQLISVSKNRISDFDLLPFVSFIDPVTSEPIFGYLGYSNGLQVLTPDIVGFKFLPENIAFTMHFLFVSLIAIYYIMKITKILGFDNLQTIFFAIVWLNCGPLVARISEGHIQLMGYYLIPGFFYYLYKIKTDSSILNYVRLGFFLGLIELLGSTHVYFQMCLILAFVSIFNPRKILMSILTLIVSILSSAIQILPIIFYPSYIGSNRSVYEGYGYHFIEKYFNLQIQSNTYELVREIIGIPFHIVIALLDSDKAISLGGWEWTLFIGFIPTFLCFLSIWKCKNEVFRITLNNLYLLPVFLISLSLVYRILFLLISAITGLIAVDRVPYRMMIYILFLLWLFTCYKLPILTRKFYDKKYLFGLLILMSYFNLLVSTNKWFIRHRVENLNPPNFILESQNIVNYKIFVLLCLIITVIAWSAFVFLQLKFVNKVK